MSSKKIKIFFAIPCGEFFSIQNRIIKHVCNTYNIDPIIIEDHSRTDSLWRKITEGIVEADYFIADISSNSPNILLELGYTIREKKPRFYGIFIASTISVPSDLRGEILQIYSSFRDFQNKLEKWIEDNVVVKPELVAEELINLGTEFLVEDFLDREKFLRLWTNPPFASFYFTEEGLRFTNAHFPIMTNYLALLRNYEFTFKARLILGAIGWVVKGTKSFRSILPEFCVMFNINDKNILTPHIFNIHKPGGAGGYHAFNNESKTVKIDKSKEGWFEITTKVLEDEIVILNGEKEIFKINFNEEPYKNIYEFPNKQGEIGFRCHPNEEAIIRYVKI